MLGTRRPMDRRRLFLPFQSSDPLCSSSIDDDWGSLGLAAPEAAAASPPQLRRPAASPSQQRRPDILWIRRLFPQFQFPFLHVPPPLMMAEGAWGRRRLRQRRRSATSPSQWRRPALPVSPRARPAVAQDAPNHLKHLLHRRAHLVVLLQATEGQLGDHGHHLLRRRVGLVAQVEVLTILCFC